MNVYLLSVLSNLQEALIGVTIITGCLLAIAILLPTIICSIEGIDFPERLRKPIKIGLGIFIPSVILLILIPSQTTLIRSYLIIEGKDIITAENVEDVASWADNKVNVLIDQAISENKE